MTISLVTPLGGQAHLVLLPLPNRSADTGATEREMDGRVSRLCGPTADEIRWVEEAGE